MEEEEGRGRMEGEGGRENKGEGSEREGGREEGEQERKTGESYVCVHCCDMLRERERERDHQDNISLLEGIPLIIVMFMFLFHGESGPSSCRLYQIFYTSYMST